MDISPLPCVISCPFHRLWPLPFHLYNTGIKTSVPEVTPMVHFHQLLFPTDCCTLGAQLRRFKAMDVFFQKQITAEKENKRHKIGNLVSLWIKQSTKQSQANFLPLS